MIQSLKCFFWKHDYEMDYKFSDNMQKIKCHHCNKKFAINHDLRAILPWDIDFEDMVKLLHEDKYSDYVSKK